MRVFISHSTKNKDIVLMFARFLEAVDSKVEVFCSSETGIIAVGENFVEKIFKELDQCDLFIPVISKEYFESKFCMIELGFAYAYFHNKYQKQGDDYIFPFAIPPVQRGEALSGTPMAGKLQVGELFDLEDVRSFLEYLDKAEKIKLTSGLNHKLNAFKYDIDQIFFAKLNIVEEARIDTYFDDSIYFEKHDDVVNHSILEQEMVMNFNMNPYEKKDVKRPNFISLAMRYVDLLDVGRYLDFNENAEMEFDLINFTNSINKITVEFKYSANHITLDSFTIDVAPGENHLKVPISVMKSKVLSEISEICFVIHPEDVVEDEGMFKIGSLKIH